MSYSGRSAQVLVLLCSLVFIVPAVVGESSPSTRSVDDALPADAPPELKELVGEYVSAGARLTVYESDGRLYADGLDLHRAPLSRTSRTRYLVVDGMRAPASSSVTFELDAVGHPVAATVGSARLPLRDIGLETIAAIQAGVNPHADRLRAAALAARPPAERSARRAADLVDLATIDPTFKFDIRYATSENFIGLPLYERAEAFLQRPAANALGRVNQTLAKHGFALLIYDGYRPWYVTKIFWDATPDSAHMFVADPAQGSRHNRGCAVDLTLYDRQTGRAVEMTGRYDEMSPRSYPDYVGGTTRQRWLRTLLRDAMESEGFSVDAQEWWHFDYQDWPQYAIGTATFSELDHH